MRYGPAPSMMGMSGDARTLAELASLAEEVGWDGFFLEDYVNAMTPADVRALKTFIEAQRVTPAPFDIVQEVGHPVTILNKHAQWSCRSLRQELPGG